MSQMLITLTGSAVAASSSSRAAVRFFNLTATAAATSVSNGQSSDAAPPGYEVDAHAEPLSKYRIGGYHPVHLGAQFKYGRYRISHKLGWGGEGTVWLARDLQASRLVALKVLVADESGRNEESALLKLIFGDGGADDIADHHPGTSHLTRLLDSFWHTGPNGTHECLVLEVAGTNVQDQASKQLPARLPAPAAWSVARQLVLAVDRLHTLGVAHADIHTRNIMLSPTIRQYSNPSLLQGLARPYTAHVNALPPNELNRHIPKYLVENTALPYPSTDPSLWHAQLVDFGQSFATGSSPQQSRTPLVLRAPELLLSKTWDHRIDIWSLACTIFELVSGKPPFDPVDASPSRLMQEWTGLFGDLPDGWRGPWNYSTSWEDDEEMSITDWLKQCYFEKQLSSQSGDYTFRTFSSDDLDCVGDLLEQMFKYRPDERLDTKGILAHRWFAKSS